MLEKGTKHEVVFSPSAEIRDYGLKILTPELEITGLFHVKGLQGINARISSSEVSG